MMKILCKYWKHCIVTFLIIHSVMTTVILTFSLLENRSMRKDHVEALTQLHKECFDTTEAERIKGLKKERDRIIRELKDLSVIIDSEEDISHENHNLKPSNSNQ